MYTKKCICIQCNQIIYIYIYIYIYISLYMDISIIVYIYMFIFKNMYICTYGTAMQPRPGDGHGWSMWGHFNKTITTTGFGGGYRVVAATPKKIEK